PTFFACTKTIKEWCLIIAIIFLFIQILVTKYILDFNELKSYITYQELDYYFIQLFSLIEV
ncbi:MAG: hypothetical protein M3044_19350, partial [Thermoproteota archaeon]|nr:hypothetical protein [Thermoproteota archaeon]